MWCLTLGVPTPFINLLKRPAETIHYKHKLNDLQGITKGSYYISITACTGTSGTVGTEGPGPGNPLSLRQLETPLSLRQL